LAGPRARRVMFYSSKSSAGYVAEPALKNASSSSAHSGFVTSSRASSSGWGTKPAAALSAWSWIAIMNLPATPRAESSLQWVSCHSVGLLPSQERTRSRPKLKKAPDRVESSLASEASPHAALNRCSPGRVQSGQPAFQVRTFLASSQAHGAGYSLPLFIPSIRSIASFADFCTMGAWSLKNLRMVGRASEAGGPICPRAVIATAR